MQESYEEAFVATPKQPSVCVLYIGGTLCKRAIWKEEYSSPKEPLNKTLWGLIKTMLPRFLRNEEGMMLKAP